MSLKIEREAGTITIENEVIKRVAGLAAMENYGIVGMAAKSVKDDVFHLLKVESLTKGITLSLNDNKISLCLHIIVEYGTNITAIADSLMEHVRYNVENIVGVEVESVEISIEGVRV